MRRLTAFAMIPFACSALAADFGLADWGDTRDEVIAAAGRPLEELELGENYFMVYADVFAGHPAELWYWLEPGGGALVAGVISAAEPSLATFYAWEEELSARFGSPEAADEFATTDERVRARASAGDAYHPFLRGDGEGAKLYFSSRRAGGFGDYDIWVSTYAGGDWGPPANLGPAVNTPYADNCPWFAPDGKTMYFSSTRPGGQGYYDIWYTVLDNPAVAPASLGRVKALFR